MFPKTQPGIPSGRVAFAVAVAFFVLFLPAVSCAEPEPGPAVHVIFERVGEAAEPPLSELETRLRSRLADRGATDLAIRIEQPSTLRLTFTDTAGGELSSWLALEPAVLEIREISYPPTDRSLAEWLPPDKPEATVWLFGEQLPADTVLLPERRRYPDGEIELQWPVKRSPIVAGADLLTAAVVEEGPWGEPHIAFDLTEAAGSRMGEASRRNVGRKMAVVLREGDDARVMSVPVIMGPIEGRGLVGGAFERGDAEILAKRMEFGALISGFRIVEKTVEPGGH